MLPTFLVIGAAKCGTTSVCDILSEHPEVFVTDPKEPYFFVRDPLQEWLPWYESLFDGAEGCDAAGEGSILYSHPKNVEKAAPRIRSMLPECRLVYMVRHPIRRLESDWKMRMIEGKNLGPISEAVRSHPDLITIGRYWSHLSVYRRYFPDEQILIVFLEDFASNPEAEIVRVLRHIGVTPSIVPESLERKRNSAEARNRAEAVGDLERRFSGIRRLRPFIPRPIRRLAVRILALGRPIPTVEWSRHALDEVRDQLQDDSQALLQFCGKSADFWCLDRQEAS